ncbi:DUF2799 domain-containing protein [Amphritea opalescens]|uniref:DUF2799 domain-containing protein n=1 Tax=Amphritea opalescens TaxID=2490544 RepID=A0A430KUA9_9GAMM|nr:DUF2799 domain-containing protein [Amphritea opalescens]RTE67115.1 DUF2799 domain-containing protein [Amphritea opalescens]
MRTRSLIVLLSLGLAGCATLDREECLSADWQLIGFNDGVVGRATERLEQHREACSEYGVVPQIDEYLQGYDQGVIRYCTATNGYREARAGNRFNMACDGDLREAFAYGFELGTQAYRQVERLDDAEEELSSLQSSQHDDRRNLEHKREQIVAEGVSSKRRSRLLHEIHELESTIRSRSFHIRRQQQAVDRESRYLNVLETDLRSQL